MDMNGGCCIGKYATGAHDMSTVDKIMLRFRPIAPKPVAGSTVSGGLSSESNIDKFSRYGAGKRKLLTVQNSLNINCSSNQRCNRRKKYSPKQNHPTVIMPLLPLTPDPQDSRATDLTVSASKEVRNKVMTKPIWLSFENSAAVRVGYPATYWDSSTSTNQPPAAGGSCVTVECVTDTWAEGERLGCTDEEKQMNLSKDTCPGFISDGYGRVTWTNESYRKMVGQGKKTRKKGEGGGVGVRLVMKETVVTTSYRSFTCRVKVQYTRGKEKGSLTAPCDVWRMDGGGFAWRLDVTAALSL